MRALEEALIGSTHSQSMLASVIVDVPVAVDVPEFQTSAMLAIKGIRFRSFQKLEVHACGSLSS